MGVRSVAFGTVGVVATGLGVALLVFPDAVSRVDGLAWLVTTLSSVDATTLAVVVGALAVGYLGVTARSRPAPESVSAESSTETRFEMATTAPPEVPTAQRQTLTAATVDDDVAEAIDVGDQALADLRAQLRVTAVCVYATAHDTSRETAQQAVEDGTWTDDRVAATFLAGPEGPVPSLWLRVRLWLVPTRERRRRIDRTLTAIEEQR